MSTLPELFRFGFLSLFLDLTALGSNKLEIKASKLGGNEIISNFEMLKLIFKGDFVQIFASSEFLKEYADKVMLQTNIQRSIVTVLINTVFTFLYLKAPLFPTAFMIEVFLESLYA